MLTKMTIRRFKRFDDVEIELANPVVFIGPNSSGKTTALQALALWSTGVKKWLERRELSAATKRTGVSINRRELVNIPNLNSYALWHGQKVRQANTPLRIEIILEGVHLNQVWECGLEFETVDSENIRCRPIGQTEAESTPYRVPEGARQTQMAFLPPLSGLSSQEDLLQLGAVNRRIGEGRTAEVLRNLCYRVYENSAQDWESLTQQLESLFGARLNIPEYNADLGTLHLSYSEGGKAAHDLTASGYGFRQMLLLLAYLYANPNTTLLLDEPDAHLEILRQRQIYQTLVQVAAEKGNQLLIATHSEVILNVAAQNDLVIAFTGKPHPVSKKDHVLNALTQYGFDHYAQAEQTGWVLYLEGTTDLSILQGMAAKLNHPAQAILERPFTHEVANQPNKALEHFFSLRDAFPNLVGIGLFDRLEKGLPVNPQLPLLMWERREIENYLAYPDVLLAYARGNALSEDMFERQEQQRVEAVMQNIIELYIPPIALHDLSHSWWHNTKISDDFLTPLFAAYYQALGLPNAMAKSNFHQLVQYLTAEQIVPEVVQKLDAILAVAQRAMPLTAPVSVEDEP